MEKGSNSSLQTVEASVNEVNLESLTEEDRNLLLSSVFRWIRSRPNGLLPQDVYWERLKTFPTVHHETVEFCRSDDDSGWEVLLDLRPTDDPNYPNQYGTQGFTVQRGDVLADLFARHEREELGVAFSPPESFTFCGLGVSPVTVRDHAYVPIFSRILGTRPSLQEGEYKRAWLPVEKLGEYAIVPSNRLYLRIAMSVMLYGHEPQYGEFLGKV